ncbi:hypothetical protein FTO70_08905 [Methanosarcina sp. KYL-1]|uniref:hypothetical protein n=1 Tax=Methanosarcina sp. KYL-1 TaxID=2602068 RepID=UPI0021012391|nr:hypothetical protein [Methanosarcina sp. KYL-1]MCQ1535793.1 hypothetical protein [Methanosarcina sp. KYL-1]
MGQKMKKYLKITIYTLVTLSLLIFVSGILVVSHPFFLTKHVNLLVKHSGTDPHEFKFQTYTKEEFALEYFNISLSEEDDFIALFESHYGTANKKDGLLLVIYDIPDPENRSTYTLYGINKYTDLVYKSTRKVHLVDEKKDRAFHRVDETSNNRSAVKVVGTGKGSSVAGN